ncbi:hypothetical protein [Blastococcus sp. CT_GayMR16]|uniref:hypothetical protein n=1 Tax=Blastococcus sp. CT_GayMR16 TaxID=2559607 RepID=UPI001072FC4A|nr:hypothetical protein [Blastococcus sp. CT_GayMR16]TFV90511.1 hypothetical protein E4P38_03560 [Blastococcus sp. CT_GayMR16]
MRKHVENAHKKNVRVDTDRLLVSFMGGTNLEPTFSPDVEVRIDGSDHVTRRVSFQVSDPRSAITLLGARANAPGP